MDMIRATVDCVQMPASMLACFFDLVFNGSTLLRRQTNSIFAHSRFAIGFELTAGELPAMLVFNPATSVTRQPRAVRDPGRKNAIGSSEFID